MTSEEIKIVVDTMRITYKEDFRERINNHKAHMKLTRSVLNDNKVGAVFPYKLVFYMIMENIKKRDINFSQLIVAGAMYSIALYELEHNINLDLI